jgi:hypothetical protein
MAVRHKEHVQYIRTNNPTSAYAMHILNNKHYFGTAEETLKLLKPCHKGPRMNCWETFYMQLFHQHGTLINEQHLNDINPLYKIADTSRIPIHAP